MTGNFKEITPQQLETMYHEISHAICHIDRGYNKENIFISYDPQSIPTNTNKNTVGLCVVNTEGSDSLQPDQDQLNIISTLSGVIEVAFLDCPQTVEETIEQLTDVLEDEMISAATFLLDVDGYGQSDWNNYFTIKSDSKSEITVSIIAKDLKDTINYMIENATRVWEYITNWRILQLVHRRNLPHVSIAFLEDV